MDVLLEELEAVSEALTKALAAEADLGGNYSETLNPSSCMARLHEARTQVQRAHEAYIRKANAYRQFVQSLPPPLRAKAIERGSRTMAFGDLWLPVTLV
jgi:hypothetical protein